MANLYRSEDTPIQAFAFCSIDAVSTLACLHPSSVRQCDTIALVESRRRARIVFSKAEREAVFWPIGCNLVNAYRIDWKSVGMAGGGSDGIETCQAMDY